MEDGLGKPWQSIEKLMHFTLGLEDTGAIPVYPAAN